MADPEDRPDNHGDGKHSQARQLADKAIRLEAAGDQDGADRLFAEATRADPDAVAAALEEAGAERPASAAPPASDAEVAGISRTIQPGADAPDRAGIGGFGSGADTEQR
jgi:hypothetical protein